MSTVLIIVSVWAIVATSFLAFCSAAGRLRRENDARRASEQLQVPSVWSAPLFIPAADTFELTEAQARSLEAQYDCIVVQLRNRDARAPGP